MKCFLLCLLCLSCVAYGRIDEYPDPDPQGYQSCMKRRPKDDRNCDRVPDKEFATRLSQYISNQRIQEQAQHFFEESPALSQLIGKFKSKQSRNYFGVYYWYCTEKFTRPNDAFSCILRGVMANRLLQREMQEHMDQEEM